jgi:hypothetical protein
VRIFGPCKSCKTGFFGDVAEKFNGWSLLIGAAVRKIEAGDIEAVEDHRAHGFAAARSRADGANDFSASHAKFFENKKGDEYSSTHLLLF